MDCTPLITNQPIVATPASAAVATSLRSVKMEEKRRMLQFNRQKPDLSLRIEGTSEGLRLLSEEIGRSLNEKQTSFTEDGGNEISIQVNERLVTKKIEVKKGQLMA